MTNEIVVVSGLPRSGTSMMMQMLAAGGVPVLSDGVRAADADNPSGYFELEAVRSLARGQTDFLENANGRAVKVIHALIRHLPAAQRCAVVFLVREVREVVASQRRMLERQGRAGAAVPDERLAEVFESQRAGALRWLREQPHIRTLEVDHAAVLADPDAASLEVSRFLGGGLDVAAMARAVDPRLHRQQSGTSA